MTLQLAGKTSGIQCRIDGRLWVSKLSIDPDVASTLRAQSTLHPRPMGNFAFSERTILELFQETDHWIGIPRDAPAAARLRGRLRPEDDARTTGYPIDVPFVKPLREKQKPAVVAMLKALQSEPHGALLDAPCGAGKTCIGLYMISKVARTTLILVHNEDLMDQWMERIKGKADGSMPAFMPSAKIGRVQGDVCDYKGKDIVFGMIQSIVSREYEPEFYRYFGHVVSDEVHRLGADKWSPAVCQFHALYRTGLSATIKDRIDGFVGAIYQNIGPVAYTIPDDGLKPQVYRLRTGVVLPDNGYYGSPKRWILARINGFLAKNEKRNRLLASNLCKAMLNGRKIIALSHLREHLEMMQKLVASGISEGGPTIGFYMGGMTREQRMKSAKADLILGTYQYAKEGLDIPDLDTIFFLTPCQSFKQAVGRTLRELEGKKKPLVVDPIDSGGPLIQMAKTRTKKYKSFNYDIKR